MSPFCTQSHFFCTDLGLIDMLLTNQNAEIVACMLLVEKFRAKRRHGAIWQFHTCNYKADISRQN